MLAPMVTMPFLKAVLTCIPAQLAVQNYNYWVMDCIEAGTVVWYPATHSVCGVRY